MGDGAPNPGWCCREPGDWLMSLLPEDPENTILKRLKKTSPERQTDTETPAMQATVMASNLPATA